MLGQKLEAYPAPQDEVLLLMERVGEAQRYAAMEMRSSSSDGKKKHSGKRGVSGADDEAGVDQALARMVEQAGRGKKMKKSGRKG